MFTEQLIILFTLCVVFGQCLANSDDRFIKKYAMMKIYESCFGPEVVKQIRQEMKEAYAKCSAPPSFEQPLNYQPQAMPSPSMLFGRLPPGFAMDPNTQTITKPGDGAGGINLDNDISNQQDVSPQKAPPNFLAFRPQQQLSETDDCRYCKEERETPKHIILCYCGPLIHKRSTYLGKHVMDPEDIKSLPARIIIKFLEAQQFPQQQSQPGPPFMMPSPNPQFRPFSPTTPYYPFPYNSPGMYYNPYGQQYNPYQYQNQYPGYFQQQQQQQPFYGSHRMGRDMDLRDRLDLATRGPSGGKVRNITCVMQELGYIDHNLEPNYEKITERISNLPVSSELKGDIQDGLQFCQKFSQCVPDMKRNVAPLSQELVKPMFFFRCYKHKKLEACIMKDIRERFTSEDELETETDFRSLGRSARSPREYSMHDPRFDALDEMAVYLYDYLSGGNGFDFDYDL